MASAGDEFERLLVTMARLRAPGGCPWDREQTMRSLRPFILEEAHELVDAIDGADVDEVREELGDLLLEVVFVTQIAAESSAFAMADVVRGIREKLVRRHPHVFSSKTARGPEEALEHWEEIKAQENKPGRESHLDGVPRALPALAGAEKLSRRAAKAGFDWPSSADVLGKVREELTELSGAVERGDRGAADEELGDLLFALTNLARHLGLDAELSLRGANRKFARRFRYLERRLRENGRRVEDTDLDELESLWREAKAEESPGDPSSS